MKIEWMKKSRSQEKEDMRMQDQKDLAENKKTAKEINENNFFFSSIPIENFKIHSIRGKKCH